MISTLSGRVFEVNKDFLIVELTGVGLQVYVPSHVIDKFHLGDMIFLYTILVVRADSLTLYGFETGDEKELFNLLLSVNGVGPRLALAILSTLTTDTIRRAVLSEQAEVFSRVPGIGKKTAQKILLQLQDRIPAMEGFETVVGMSDIDSEILAALTTLGYSLVESQAALQSIPRDTPQEIEIRLRIALQFFA